ncbi:hypothetical protein PN441_19985 [Spirulina major CS-329]|uniref:hypothetical protein n=1 Tax=Spirulina TaxID=1154 RepID=UPI00232E99D1|nr:MULTISPECIES: hypothetical protein [Spirulina]MDB9497017.1 hypothetical protein [Spirulina subsalsa CS-330]MDB9505365.1 hypothetical protein [Spirulina major CS-329]
MSKVNLHLGIDFGTSFTKVCVRDVVQSFSWLVAFGQGQSCEENMLSSQIGIMSNGQVLAGLTTEEWKQQKEKEPKIKKIDFIKMRLIEVPIDQKLGDSDICKLAAYYLSRVIWRSKSWIKENSGEFFEGEGVDWSAQICVPVQYCDSPIIQVFQKVFDVAWLLSEDLELGSGIPPSDNLSDLTSKIGSLEPAVKALTSSKRSCSAVPEVTAVIFSSGSNVGENITAVFDIGSGTIEGASCHKRADSSKKNTLKYYAAKVEWLGVEAIAAEVAQNLRTVTNESVKKMLFQHSSNLSESLELVAQSLLRPLSAGESVISQYRQKDGALKLSQEAIEQRLSEKSISKEEEKVYLKLLLAIGNINRLVGSVIAQKVKPKEPDSEVYRARLNSASSLDILICGGGSQIEFYKDAILSTYTAFNHNRTVIPKYSLNYLPVPKKDELSMSGVDRKYYYRFNVAYGLSDPDLDKMLESKLPSQPSGEHVRYSNPMTGPLPLMDDD